jgi:hypothetical protein
MSDDVSIKEMLGMIFLILFVVIIIGFIYINFIGTSTPNVVNEEKIEYLTYSESVLGGDVEDCDLIEDDQEKINCELKIGKCSTDMCYFQKASGSYDESLCFEIKDSSLRSTCSQEINKGEIYFEAVENNDVSKCLLFEEEEQIQYCEDNFYYVQSINLNNKNLCETIISEKARSSCYNEIQ